MKLEFDEVRHQYRLDGERCPSVTQVISILAKLGLDWWAYGLAINGVLAVMRQCTVDPDHPDCEAQLRKALTALKFSPNAVIQEAAKRGSEVHKAFVDFAQSGEKLPANDGYLKSLALFLDEFSPKIVKVEESVYSPSLKVAGTYDALLEIDGQLTLIDWKTSKRIYDSHHLQSAAYEGMRQELGEKPATPMVVRLDPDGKVPEFIQSRATYDDFKAAHVLWKARKRIEAEDKRASQELKLVA